MLKTLLFSSQIQNRTVLKADGVPQLSNSESNTLTVLQLNHYRAHLERDG